MEKSLGNKFKDKELKIADNLLSEYKNNDDYVILYHSSTAKNNSNITAEGVVAHFGAWLEECLHGAVDEEELFNNIKENTKVAFFSEKPDWVKMKISKEYNIPLSEVGNEEIKKYGQLAIIIADKDDMDFIKAGDKDEDYIKETLFLNGEVASSVGEVPFGVERGDIYTETTIIPDATLTGESLLAFLIKHFPNDYKAKEKNTKIQKIKPV